MDNTPILGNEENNQLLLNAIRNKFAAQNGTTAAITTATTSSNSISCSPPTFTIPALKSFNCSGAASADGSPKLNQFILGQLSEQCRLNGDNVQTAGGFTLPKLMLGAASHAPKFTIPLLSAGAATNLAGLNESLNKLKVSAEEQKSEKQPLQIDLSTALSSSASTASIRLEMRTKAAAAAAAIEQFEIPFVECDRSGETRLLNISNEYCQTDVSDLELRHSLVAPSACGRIICLSYARALQQQRRCSRIGRSMKTPTVKHIIKRFGFDTKSPDDLVLATINKYMRQSHT